MDRNVQVTASIAESKSQLEKRVRMDPQERCLLVERATSGDEESFEVLVHAYERSIFLAVRQKVYSELEAEEVAQEVFVRAFFALPKLRDQKRFVGWLHGIAHNCVLSHIERKLRRAPPLPLSEEIPIPEPDCAETAPTSVLRAVGGLPERYRQIVNLHFLEDMSQEDISRSLGIAPGTVRSRLHRGIGLLRKTMDADSASGDKRV